MSWNWDRAIDVVINYNKFNVYFNWILFKWIPGVLTEPNLLRCIVIMGIVWTCDRRRQRCGYHNNDANVSPSQVKLMKAHSYAIHGTKRKFGISNWMMVERALQRVHGKNGKCNVQRLYYICIPSCAICDWINCTWINFILAEKTGKWLPQF